MEHARALIQKKKSIEEEIEAQVSILKANNSTLQTPLVDADGFPRADIDVFAVRSARVRIIELRNDLSSVTNEVGKALETIYDPANAPKEVESEQLKPFARINAVSPGSPAAEAGLQSNDLVLKFGPLDHNACSASLQPLTEVVSANENRHVIIKVLRSGQTIHLTLKPRTGWGGRGMLGCHLLSYSATT
ncbi:hypothetical protein H0H92_006529 [Tricholoma furcatifolium]|nr:hypothetical protein H0H92_006529 [Tricholoma furcatifolium]